MKMKINVKRKFQKIVNGHTEGYSLIEVIMVLVMTGIITAIAIPRLAGFSGVDAYSAARQVKSDIRYTQELAMSNFRKTTITFDADADPGAYAITSSGTTLNRELPPSSKATFNAVDDGTTSLIYTFNSYGEPDSTDGAGDTLRISTPGSSVKDITVRAMTGRAAIQ